MAQTGLHSLIATAITEKTVPAKHRSKLAWGILLGSVLPDIDALPMAIAYLITGNTSTVYLLHRSGTHSLFAVILLFLVCIIISKIKKMPVIASLGCGLSLGILLHIIVDLLWWGPVDLLWPLGFFGWHSEIYLLQNHPLTPMAAKLLGSGEFLFYALYFIYLRRLARKKQTNLAWLPKLNKLINIQFISFTAFIILAFFIPRMQFEILLYALLIVFYFPLFIYIITRLKNTIESTGKPNP